MLDVYTAGKLIWDYLELADTEARADALIVLGSNDVRVASHAAKLMQQNMAEVAVFSGAQGRTTTGVLQSSEAEVFAKTAQDEGLPISKILVELKATNTGENILFSMQMLRLSGLWPSRVTLVQKNYMARRACATFKKHFPNVAVGTSAPKLDYASYPNEKIGRDLLINTMVGDLQRLRVYGQLGYQVEQDIPEGVWTAYEFLVSSGYNEQLIR
ncbi:MAG: YdcF family protein [Cyanobacteria bacterium P01_F01_bin.42]